jgi:two-component system capsular synthesis sensor histidine kinase RcsC
VQQVLINLITNAIKFSANGKTIFVNLTVTPALD